MIEKSIKHRMMHLNACDKQLLNTTILGDINIIIIIMNELTNSEWRVNGKEKVSECTIWRLLDKATSFHWTVKMFPRIFLSFQTLLSYLIIEKRIKIFILFCSSRRGPWGRVSLFKQNVRSLTLPLVTRDVVRKSGAGTINAKLVNNWHKIDWWNSVQPRNRKDKTV